MTIIKVRAEVAAISLTSEEILIINHALNEVCNGLDLVGEFDTRMGCSVDEARSVLADIGKIARQMTASN